MTLRGGALVLTLLGMLWAIDSCKQADPPEAKASKPGPPAAQKETPDEDAKASPTASPPQQKSPAEQQQVARAQAVLGGMKKNLKQALQGGIKEGGPVAAISACQIKAPKLAADASTQSETTGVPVRVGRTSKKLRNPKNAGPAWTAPLLDRLEADAKMTSATVVLDGGKLGYVERINTGGMCLMCHGKTIAPDVAKALAKAYPEDKATGFELGQMRGVFWAEVAALPKG